MKTLKVLELFGGISAPYEALKNININFEIIDYVEFDKKVVEIRNIIHNSNYQAKSVIDYHCNKEIDLLIGGSPCQDFSIAGLNKGGNKDSNTRSSLIWEQLRILTETKPKYYIWENVKGVLNKNHIETFNKHNEYVKNLGYKVYFKVLNSKNFGIPQNRNRVFVIAIRNDLKQEFNFNHLENKELPKLNEFLEYNVSDCYYITQKSMINAIEKGKIKIINNIVETITTKQWRWNNSGVIKIPLSSFNAENIINNINSNIQTITATGAQSRIKIAVKKINNKFPIFIINNKKYNLRILTEKECFALMGFKKEYVDLLHIKNISKNKIYYVAGNSIVVNVLETIFKELIKE